MPTYTRRFSKEYFETPIPWPPAKKQELPMVKELYSVRDTKAAFFNPPFPQHSEGECQRTMLSLTQDQKTSIASYPQDFDVYYLGTFDDSTGKMDLLPAPEHKFNIEQLLAQMSGKN